MVGVFPADYANLQADLADYDSIEKAGGLNPQNLPNILIICEICASICEIRGKLNGLESLRDLESPRKGVVVLLVEIFKAMILLTDAGAYRHFFDG